MSLQRRANRFLISEAGATAPWVPSLRITIRVLLVARIISALHRTIADCDETYNYWEPLHLLSHPPRPLGHSQTPFQTWEYSPEYAIRSWAYVAQYWPIASAFKVILQREKTASFYAVRIFMAVTSSVCEAKLVEAVAKAVHPRIARYMLVTLVFSAGMYESATALLPSTFVMYTTTLAWSFALAPAVDGSAHFPINASYDLAGSRRTLAATAVFALGALLGWPFALVLSFPFVFEQLFLPSGLVVSAARYAEFVWLRCRHWASCVLASSLIAVPIFAIDSLAYGRPLLVPLNIISYNVLSAKRGAGPTLYGVEPWYFYLLNLLLQFGPALPLALVSLPAVLLSNISFASHTESKGKKDGTSHAAVLTSSPKALLVLRLMPLYVWLGLLSTQPHKEERFVYPAYPLLCFNAAVGLYCLQNIVQAWSRKVAGGVIRDTNRRIGKFASITLLTLTSIFALSRSLHVTTSYRAPYTVLSHLRDHELPRIVAYTLPDRQSESVRVRLAAALTPVLTQQEHDARSWTDDKNHDPYVPLVSLLDVVSDEKELRLCYGKEWYRFPTTYLVPDGVTIDFIKSEFSGILPKHFADTSTTHSQHSIVRNILDPALGWLWPWKSTTRARHSGFNDLNIEEMDRYVDVQSCDYLVDVDWPHVSDSDSVSSSLHEPRYATDARNWTRVFCTPFLDAMRSRVSHRAGLAEKIRATMDRTLWLPSFARGTSNKYGDYCLLRTTNANSLANVAAPQPDES